MSIFFVLQLISTDPQIGTVADNMTVQGRSDTTLFYAQIAPVCSVSASSAEAEIDVSSRGEQTIGEVDYRCNSANGFTRRISSANNGQLRRGSQGIPYYVSQSGDGALAISRVQLTQPVVDQVPASALLTVGSSGFFKVEVPNLPRGLLAGEYRDTVSIEITGN